MLSDEQIARKYHEIERAEYQQRIASERSDEELARRMSTSSFDMKIPASPRPNDDHLLIQMGQKASVRLHNPLTGSLIGEAFECRYIDSTTMSFELKKKPGFRLRISERGKVEFSDKEDPTTLFFIELVNPSGSLYIICKAHASKINISGEPIWYLSLNADCQLIGNGSRNPNSLWVLVAAGENNSPRSNSSGQYQSVVLQDFVNFKSQEFLKESSKETSTKTSTTYTTTNGSAVGTAGGSAVTLVATNALAARSRDYTRDDSAIEAQLRWLSTAAGQQYLSSLSSAARTMYSDGTLKRILHRPDWPRVAERWKDYAKLAYPVNRQFAEQYLTIGHRQQFYEQGYCVVSDVIHPNLLENARKLAMFWAGRYPEDREDMSSEHAGCKLKFSGVFATDCDFLALFYETVIVQIVEIMIGEGVCTAPQICEVVLSYPSLLDPASTLDGTGWVIEGFEDGEGGYDHSPYTLLIGIALTDVEVYSGGFAVFPASHVLLREYVLQQVQTKSTAFSTDTNPQKPFLTNSCQVPLKAGDVFFCTQKLAKVDVPNSGESVSVIAYFKVSNINHEIIKNRALEHVWYEFKGATEFSSPLVSPSGGPPLGQPSVDPRPNGFPGARQPRFFAEDVSVSQSQRNPGYYYNGNPGGSAAPALPPSPSANSTAAIAASSSLSRTGSFRQVQNGPSRTGAFQANPTMPPPPSSAAQHRLNRPPSIMDLMN